MQARLEKGEADPNAQFVFTTRGGQFIRARMVPVLAATRMSASEIGDQGDRAESPRSDSPAKPRTAVGGFVMTLENSTHTFELDSTRDMLLQSLTEGSRAALANIRAAVETLTDYPACEQVHRDRFIQVIREEARNLSGKLDKTTSDLSLIHI